MRQLLRVNFFGVTLSLLLGLLLGLLLLLPGHQRSVEVEPGAGQRRSWRPPLERAGRRAPPAVRRLRRQRLIVGSRRQRSIRLLLLYNSERASSMVRELIRDGTDRREREQRRERRVRGRLEPGRREAAVDGGQRVESRIAVGEQVAGGEPRRGRVAGRDDDGERHAVAAAGLLHGARPAAAGSRARLDHACAGAARTPRFLQHTPVSILTLV